MRIRLLDRFAWGCCVLFGLALLVLLGAVLTWPADQPLFPTALVLAFLAVLFGFQGWRFLGQARSQLVLEPGSVARSGRTGWRLPRTELLQLELDRDPGGPLLRLRVGPQAAQGTAVRRAVGYAHWTERRHRAADTIVLRIHPEDADQLRSALDAPSG